MGPTGRPMRSVSFVTLRATVKPDMASYLVLANRTIGGTALTEHLAEIVASDPDVTFTVVVPVTHGAGVPLEIGGAMGGIAVMDVDTEQLVVHDAYERLDQLMAWFAASGVEATGDVVVGDAVTSIERIRRTRPFDRIIVSTLPSTISRWLRLDLARRVERRFGLPVTTITGPGAVRAEPVGPADTKVDEAPAPAPSEPRARGASMGESVYKIIELVGTSSESWEKAAAAAVLTASKSLRDLRVAEVAQLDLVIDEGAVVVYRAKVKVSFKYQTDGD